ncbi:MAG: nicotinate-nucleotide adenylyltransferase [Actinomycetaceae bacterium]|nr:nicotinate-nucleotide adenylyltransferase [Actinomycetaceae bacterium]
MRTEEVEPGGQVGPSNRRVRVGIMGGTFDPIHNGHLVAASEVQHAFALDEVVFVPTATQPFKRGRKVSDPEHRYLMTVIATSENPRFSVSRVDIDRGGVTYTIDTLRDLRRERPNAEFFFITGADALARIAKWKDHEELFKMAHFVGVSRPGHELPAEVLRKDVMTLVEIPALAISSTDVRARSHGGVPIWYLVPDGVVRYIWKYCLYQDVESTKQEGE